MSRVQRPRSHEIADQAEKAVALALPRAWTTERLGKDYGEDLLTRIFEAGEATPYRFLIQVKGTERIDKYSSSAGALVYRVERHKVEQWAIFPEPVLFALWDAVAGRAFWVFVQEFCASECGRRALASRGKTIGIHIPLVQCLNRTGIQMIEQYVKSRVGRHIFAERALERILAERRTSDIGVPREAMLRSGGPRTVATLVFGAAALVPEPNQKTVLVVEEPEVGLHPRTKKLTVIIRTKDSQVVMTASPSNHDCNSPKMPERQLRGRARRR